MILKQVFFICCLFGLIRQNADAQAPVPDFSANTTSGCGPLAVYFKDLSTGTPTKWEWDLGNGQISSLQNPATTYTTPGIYTVTLIVRNASGTNSIRKTNYISVYPYPTVSFSSSLNQGPGCAPVNVQFTDNSTPGQGSINSWLWNFGDGTNSTQPDPVHNYSQTGYYTVGLTVTNSQGCRNTAAFTRYIRIVPGVQINFAWTQTSASCTAPFTLAFQNQTSGPGNLSYSWNFGNGSSPATSTLTNPSTTYPSNANYTVTLHAVSDLGCSADTQEVVSLATGNAIINAPDSACINTPVNFINGSSPPPLSVYWNFGDGTNSVAVSPTKTYTATGTFPVKLVNTYSACADSLTRPIKIVNTPVPDFTADHTAGCQAPFTVNFTAILPGATSWSWDFGDGSTSTLPAPSHTYSTTGSFDVTLTASNGGNCNGTAIKHQFIQIVPPTIGIGNAPVKGCINTLVKPVPAVNAVDGVASYSWSAPGATPSTSNSATPSFSYPSQGTYDLTLTITTNGGCTMTQTFPGIVFIGIPTNPTFTVSAPTTCGSNPFTFTSTASPADTWAWIFGDGTYGGDAATIQHSYTDTGNFTVQLIASNHGCAQTGGNTVVRVNPPIANFGFKADCANKLNVTFTDSSIVDRTQGATYVWDFGDGSVVTITAPPAPFPGSPPPHLYSGPLPATYTVTLTVTNGGCTSTFFKTIHLSSPVASIQPLSQACRDQFFRLTSTSTLPDQIVSYHWTVGTYTYDTTSPVITTKLEINGPYSVGLTITDSDGCQSIAPPATVNITSPTAKYLPIGNITNGGCVNSLITLTDASTPNPSSAPIQTWTLDFADGTVQTQTPPTFTHQYTTAGNYVIRLTVTDLLGCTGNFFNPFAYVITSPKAGFYAKDTLYCPNAPLPFTDTSSGTIKTYYWDFGDGFTDNTANPSHPFAPNVNLYTIKLKITDQVGCSDSLTRTNYINIRNPLPAFTMTDSIGICVPLQTTFTPNAQYYDSLYWDFGDGTTSTLPVTTHFYNSFNTFNVSLVLKGAGGCIDSATQRVQVLNSQTNTTFTYSPLRNCDSVRAFFTIMPPPDTRFTLFFGDGQADSSENLSPNHLYNTPSTYAPQLLLQDSSGCIVPIGSVGIIVLGAVPFFSMDKKAFCDSGTVNFTNYTISNDGPIQQTWDFGDGQSSSDKNPSNYYTIPGIHLVTLNITTDNNCKENFTDTVHVWQTPHPLITVPTPYCITSPIPMQSSLVTPDVDSVSWSWNFGDGQSSSLQNPSVSYAKPGQYNINLRTSVVFGCSDSTNYNLMVNPLPFIKGPKVINTPVGVPVAIPFTYSNDVVTYTWTPDSNLSCTTCPNPMANPTFATLYVVTVTDTSNCSFSDSILVNTICNDKNYFVPNTFSPNGDGVNDVFYPRGTNLYNVQSMRIFNRWGQMVFERRDFPANSQSMGWDGTFNGRQAPSDTYVYVMEVVCNNAQVVAIRGDVTLLR